MVKQGVTEAASAVISSTRTLAFVGALAAVGAPAVAQDLVGVAWDTGDVYHVDGSNAATTLIGSTNVTQLAALEIGPDGVLYAFAARGLGEIYSIDPFAPSATLLATVATGTFVFEGGLAFGPNGKAYGTNLGSSLQPMLFEVDLVNGAFTVIGTIAAEGDINGLAWRRDGVLVGIDRVTNGLLEIDPNTAASTQISIMDPVVGGVSGMTVVRGRGYFCTNGPTGSIPGSSELYSFDLFTGSISRIGDLAVPGSGVSGLAVMPCSGSLSSYGNGTPGSGAFTPQIGGNGCPELGARVSIDVTEGLGGAAGCLMLGLRPDRMPLLGGTLLVTPQALIPHRLDGRGPGNGGFSLPFAIPRVRSAIGVDHYFQAIYADPGARLGVSFTEGLQLTIGGGRP